MQTGKKQRRNRRIPRRFALCSMLLAAFFVAALSQRSFRVSILAALEQVIEAADPKPAVAVSLEQQVMLSVFSSLAVALGQ